MQPEVADNERNVSLFHNQVGIGGPEALSVKILEGLAGQLQAALADILRCLFHVLNINQDAPGTQSNSGFPRMAPPTSPGAIPIFSPTFLKKTGLVFRDLTAVFRVGTRLLVTRWLARSRSK